MLNRILPIDPYRAMAAALLVGLLGITLLAPLRSPAPAPETVWLPPFDGQPPATLADTVLDYPPQATWQQPEPPPRATLLRESGLTQRALRTLAAEMLIESSNPEARPPGAPPPDPKPVRDEVLMGGPERWNNLEEFYKTIRTGQAANGLGIVETLRASHSEDAERDAHQRQALFWFNLATGFSPASGPYRYNWALLQLSLGHYQEAAANLDLLIKQGTDRPEVRFHEGLALLRLGDPDGALAAWQPLVAGAANDWQDPAREGQADALVAQGNIPAAAQAYEALLTVNNTIDWGIYTKLLRLRLQRGGTPALDLVAGLIARFPAVDQLRYDQGRLLLLLNHPAAPADAFRTALTLRTSLDDPAFHTALAQALLASGDANKALGESEATLRAVRLDPTAADLSLTYSKLDGASAYQRSVGQVVLNANVVRAQALARLGQTDRVRTLADAVEQQGAGADPAKAAWFRYYAGLISAAGGQQDAALTRLKPPAPGVGLGPGRGALLLAWVRSLTPAQAADQAGAIVAAAGGSDNPPLTDEAATAWAYYELARRLDAAGTGVQAALFYRAAAAWEGYRASSLQRPLIGADGSEPVVLFRAAEADYLRRQRAADPQGLATTRYQQAINAAPLAAGLHTGRGQLFYVLGDTQRAQREFELAARVDPRDPLAAHNLGVLALHQGLGSLGPALDHLGTARLAAGPDAIQWGDAILAPAPPLGDRPAAEGTDWGARLPALIALVLLLGHTLRPVPGGGTGAPAGMLAGLNAALATRPLAVILGLAVAVAGLTWSLALAGGLASWQALLPLGLLAALVAIGVQEGIQHLAVRRERQPGTVQTRLWLPGVALSVIGAPLLGLVYGWLVTTHAAGPGTPPAAPLDGPGDLAEAPPPVAAPDAPPAARSRRSTAAPARRAAPARAATTPVASAEERVAWRGWAALGPVARVAAVGLLANAGLALLFALAYGQWGSPLWRILLVGNLAVLAFTAVADPAADGWPLWRRSPLLWLLLFGLGAAALTALLLGAW